jgi:hypothetical protein
MDGSGSSVRLVGQPSINKADSRLVGNLWVNSRRSIKTKRLGSWLGTANQDLEHPSRRPRNRPDKQYYRRFHNFVTVTQMFARQHQSNRTIRLI